MTAKRFDLLMLVTMMAFCRSIVGQVGANIGGIVTDSTGAAIPGATVILKNRNTGTSQLLKTGSEGNYRAVNLTPAEYEIMAEALGFGITRKIVTLPVGSEVTTDLSLGLSGVSVNVTVEASAGALIEVAKSQPSS